MLHVVVILLIAGGESDEYRSFVMYVIKQGRSRERDVMIDESNIRSFESDEGMRVGS